MRRRPEHRLPEEEQGMDYDLIIRNGAVVDGTRLPRYRADVGVKAGKVVKIGRIAPSATAARELDASGCIVAPGFVDLHTHYDAQIHWDPYCTISGWHGVTSLVLGNCGFGFAPVKPEARERSLQMMTRTEQIPYESMKAGMAWRWETFPEWLDNLARLPKGLNIISYVPLSPLLVYVMGLEAAKSRPATPAERAEMKRLLNEAMDAGACGFSLQRLGKDSVQSDVDGTPMPTDCMADEDVLALAEVLRDRDEGFIQITQAAVSEEDLKNGTVREPQWAFLEKLAETAQRPIIHNAVVVMDRAPDFHIKEMEWVHRVNEKGLRIFAQGINTRSWFDFTLDRWNLFDASPAWRFATLGAPEERRRKMADPAIRAQMVAENQMIALGLGADALPENCTVIDVGGSNALQKYVGRTLGEIGAEEGKSATEAMLDISLAGDLKVMFRTAPQGGTDPVEVGKLMSDPYVIPGVSDGGAHVKFFTGGSYPTELLTWLVRDTKQMSLEEAHYHLSYLPAQAAGFFDRGYLREGAPADIVVYDLAKLKRTPEWSYEIAHDFPADEWRLVQRAEGYRWTIVNGAITFEDGVCTGATPGVLLRNREIGTQLSSNSLPQAAE
jgi:N-acyl-D-aspartate/D-glutamate deacylase